MTTWSIDDLDRIADSTELRIASRRGDGTLRAALTVWVVRSGDELYVRSMNGRDSSWFRGAQTRHEGHIRAHGLNRDVTFVEEADGGLNDRIDSAYRDKYGRYGDRLIQRMTSPNVRAATIRLVPRA